ncbi:MULTISPECIES: type I-F CRISPR-associated endoribonuclease Cas6/Csy4 [Salinimonas]|uniref:Type I-F CRISPR-associated endoribonuclease Cas6/Csy4 n=2 Tax=Salinimonas TaxID=288793 RepID=A0A5B7YIS5_9ALTE|nr:MULTISPECIES: type I-F CRISPR-associated endoribonuclease Cas6/Csy4 [Salinimonas]MBD3587540.1 type I-F CRISPR-associated endoribonuclease Cas6/Csy4 [Salinimonas profundi]QCZ95547.1 type I-F CRISPR-associated endoribonuclease Cas6/Csy4 [Salinimonas iocasae]
MDHYLDIKILEDPEFTAPILMNALFSKLHRALVAVSDNDIGVSFPSANRSTLGKQLRVHGTKERLEQLEQFPWRKGLGDFTNVVGINKTPDTKEYWLVQRMHVQSSPDRLRRRAMKRHSLTYDQAVERIPDSAGKRLDLPFIRIKSRSTNGQQFPLFIKQTLLAEVKTSAIFFSKYGLSATTPVPKF